MNKKYNLYRVNSFTKDLNAGNPAGVVLNADGLTENQMQEIAKEVNFSETAFISEKESNEHDVKIRFFTPKIEVPICGHATIAAHYVRAIENKIKSCRVLQKTGAGILPVDIIENDGDYKIVMTQGKPKFGAFLNDKNKQILLSALYLNEDDLNPNCPIQIVSTGHSKVMIGIKTRTKLNKLNPDFKALTNLSKIINCNGYFVFTFDTNDKNILTTGRMFAPAIGVNEDPVTGNANGPLGAYLVHHKLVKFDGNEFKFIAKQGEAMGRPGILFVNVKIENSEPVQVKIGGQAIIVSNK